MERSGQMTDQPRKSNVRTASTALPNHRRELFAQLLVQGFTAVDAHEKAGYKRHDGNACTLAKHPEVQARLEEIRGELAAENLMDQAQTILACAMERGQMAAPVSALKEKGILSGKRIERSEVGLPGEFDHMSDEELRQSIIDQARELGFIMVESSEPQH